MARTLIRINGMETAKYQELPEHTKKMLLSQQKQALKLGAYFEVEDNELILYYPGLMPGEGLEQRVYKIIIARYRKNAQQCWA